MSSDIVLIDLKILNNFSEISLNSCLICITNKGKVSIYDETSEITLAEKIKSFADLTITTDFPNSVCANCEISITNCYKLKKQFENSVKTFTLMLEKKKNMVNICQSPKINLNEIQKNNYIIKSNKPKIIVEEAAKPSIKQNENQICISPNVILIEATEINENDCNYLNEKSEDSLDCLDLNETTKTELKNDMIVEDKPINSSNLKCEKCDKVFKQKSGLLLHKKLHNGKQNYECDICNTKFELRSDMKEHKKKHKIEKFMCEICSVQYNNIKSFNNHKLIHEQPKYKCTELGCHKSFHKSQNLYRHLLRHTGIRYPCNQCDETFSADSALRSHKKRIHLGIKNFKCLVCEKEFFNLYNYQTHMRFHTGEKPYSCEICEKKYTTRTQLNKHLNSKHNIDLPDRKVTKKNEKFYECDQCHKKMYSLVKLNKHIETHLHNNNNNICKICNKTLSNSGHLKNHMRKHIGDTTYKCHVCDKILSTSHSLECHLRIHTGEKPFKCKFCSKSFNNSPGLVVHERIHTGVKYKECTICQKSFNSDAHLKVHMRMHTGEKPFQCPFCNKNFATNGYLTVHIRIHKGEKRFSCNECDAKYDRISHLNAHIEKQHKIIETDEEEYSNTEKYNGNISEESL